MKSSCSPVQKSAGMKHSLTWVIGVSLVKSNPALFFMVFFTKVMAALTKNLGTLVWDVASSSQRVRKLENGESRTRPAMLGSRFPCKSAVTAPIDLPHRPIVDTFLCSRKYSTITATSSLSNQPSEINSPSERPHPGKSKQKRVMFAERKYSTSSSASNRH